MYDALRYFVATSFHEDWDAEGANDGEVVSAFKGRDPEVVADVVIDIRSYLASEPTELEVHDRLIEMGCAYDPSPDGLSDKAWLDRLATLLEACG